MTIKQLLDYAVQAAFTAGDEILKIYATDFYVETKSDNTPVTLADKTSGKYISKILDQTKIPVISEEEEIVDFSTRKHWDRVWIVDPLDGTKEYVKRNGEFAVNIALIERNKPIIGVIYAPVLQDLYFGGRNLGSYKINRKTISGGPHPSVDELLSLSKKLPLQKLPADYTMIASRSHISKEIYAHMEDLKRTFGVVDVISVGSSIKQCWVAEGRAHEYPRYGPTMEWDTAAGQCILEESGNQLIDLNTNKPMLYNRENMRNNYFLAKHSFRK